MYLCKQNMKNNKNTTSMKKLYSFLAMCLVSLSMMAQTTELQVLRSRVGQHL